MPTMPTPELEFIEKYGPLPDRDTQQSIRSAIVDFDEEWYAWWRASDPDRDQLERLYEFWSIQRDKIKE